MMKTYAKVDNGVVTEIITPTLDLDGVQYPLEVCFPEEFVTQCVDITDLVPKPEQRWTYDGSIFFPEAPPALDAVAINEAQKQSLLARASQAMAPILVSLQLGNATDEETSNASAWQEYYRALKLVDVTLTEPAWPVTPR